MRALFFARSLILSVFAIFACALGCEGQAFAQVDPSVEIFLNQGSTTPNFGQSVTIGAQFLQAMTGDLPTGTVTFTDSLNDLSGTIQVTSGFALLQKTVSIPGAHNITASFS